MKRKASSPQKELILYKELKKSSQDSIQKQNNKINLQSILPKIGQIHSKNETFDDNQEKIEDCSYSTNSQILEKTTNILVKHENEKINYDSFIDINSNLGVDLMNNTLLIKSKILGPKRIRLGLCCLNNFLRTQKNPVFCSRTMTLETYKNKGSTLAMEKALDNIKDLMKLIEWNKDHHIECLRMSTYIFPHYANIYFLTNEERYTMDFAKQALKMAGDLAKKYNHRITMHPGPFNVLGTENAKLIQKTVAELSGLADILDAMGMDHNSIMVVHGGGTYGDKEKTIQRWISNYLELPDKVKNRLVLENCEKNFSIIDCLKISNEINVPIVFDNHHFNCYKLLHLMKNSKMSKFI